jgi:hypothetical protein
MWPSDLFEFETPALEAASKGSELLLRVQKKLRLESKLKINFI